jgi:hypothetical protein
MRLALIAIATSAFHAAIPLAAQTPARFDASRLVAHRDSFVVLAQGKEIGFMREVLESSGDGFRLVSDTEIGGAMKQTTDLTFSKAGAMIGVTQRGTARGQEMKIDVTYAGGRAKGSATTPQPSGMSTITVDTLVPAGAIDDNALQTFLPTLELAEGVGFRITLFASGKGEPLTLKARNTGSAKVTVPAGTFDTWKVELTGGPMPVTMFVSKTQPRRVVRVALEGSPVEFQLVK